MNEKSVKFAIGGAGVVVVCTTLLPLIFKFNFFNKSLIWNSFPVTWMSLFYLIFVAVISAVMQFDRFDAAKVGCGFVAGRAVATVFFFIRALVRNDYFYRSFFEILNSCTGSFVWASLVVVGCSFVGGMLLERIFNY